MGNCLVTKLKGVVDNDNLPILNAFCIEVNDSDNHNVISIRNKTNAVTAKVVGNGGGVSLTNGDYVTELNIPADPWPRSIYLKKGSNYKVYLSNKFDIDTIQAGSSVDPMNYGFDLSQCNFMDMQYLRTGNSPSYGELGKLAGSTSFNVVEGSPFAGKINLDTVIIPSYVWEIQSRFGYISGNVNVFNNKKGLIVLDIIYCGNITGDINELLDAQVAAGRTSGSIRIGLLGSKVLYNGALVTLESFENHYYMRATFSGSGYTITYEN